MKFIRRGGRVIPIREKGDVKKVDTVKVDAINGALTGGTAALFYKRLGNKVSGKSKFAIGLTIVSGIGAAATSILNFKQEERGRDIFKKEIYGNTSKNISAIAAGALGVGFLKGAHKLKKAIKNFKTARAAKAAKSVVKIAGYLK